MRVGIDVSQIIYGTGVSVYTKKLVSSLLSIDKENEYIVFGGSLRRKNEILSVFPGSKVFTLPPSMADFLWNRLHVFPIEKLVGKIDVLHTSDWAEPPSSAFKVTTVHDLYPLKFPKLVHPKVLEVHKRKLYWVKKESKRIIVPSNTTKEDLAAAGFGESIIRVIPEAPLLWKAQDSEVEAVKKKYNVRGQYMISIGVTSLKNTEKIIKAFRLASAGKDLKLLVVGRPSNIKLQPERNIRYLGYVPENDLSALLSGSRGLIFTSLYEGFGIPILEGFSCGIPVVTSDLGSMKEVAGKAAILVNPTDTNSIADGISQVIRGAKAYVDKGTARVKEFSWEKTAQMTLDVYKEANE